MICIDEFPFPIYYSRVLTHIARETSGANFMKLFTHVAFLMLFVLPLIAFAQPTPLRILEKPKPELPKDYGMLDVQGVVRLRIEFLANGMVGKVFVISGLTKELGQLAAEAAKKIRFEPKMENGVKVTSFRVIEYSYNWRTCGWGCSTEPSTSGRDPIKV